MAVYNPPWTITASSQTAESCRRMLHYLNGGRPGVVGSGLAVSQKGGTPNMSVDITEGSILVAGTEASYQGSYFCESQGTVNVAIAASHASLPRLDLIVARVRDQQYSGATNSWALEAVTGTAASPARYPTVPANSFVLAVVSVAAASTQVLNAAITDLRSASATDGVTTLVNRGYGSATGGVVACTSATRPTANLTSGLEIYEVDTAKQWRWNGSAWKAAGNDGDGVWTSFTPTTAGIGSPTLDCAWTTLVDTVVARYNVTLAGAGSATTVLLGLPVTAHSSVQNTYCHTLAQAHDASAGQDSMAAVKIETGGTTLSFWTTYGTPSASAVWFGTTVPFVWASSDTINFTIVYRRS